MRLFAGLLAIVVALSMPTFVSAERSWPEEGHWVFFKRNKLSQNSAELWYGDFIVSPESSVLRLVYSERSGRDSLKNECFYSITRDTKGAPSRAVLQHQAESSDFACLPVDHVTIYDQNGWIGISHSADRRGARGYLTRGSAFDAATIWTPDFGPFTGEKSRDDILGLQTGMALSEAKAMLAGAGFTQVPEIGNAAGLEDPMLQYLTFGRDPDAATERLDIGGNRNALPALPAYRDVVELELVRGVTAGVHREVLPREDVAPGFEEVRAQLDGKYANSVVWRGLNSRQTPDLFANVKSVDQSGQGSSGIKGCSRAGYGPTDFFPLDQHRFGLRTATVFGGVPRAEEKTCGFSTTLALSRYREGSEAVWIGITLRDWRLIRWMNYKSTLERLTAVIAGAGQTSAKGSGPVPDF